MFDFDNKHRVVMMLIVAMLILISGCKSDIKEPIIDEPIASASPEKEIAPSPPPEPATTKPQLPQMDCSTARIPITNAIYDLFTGTYGYEGPEPMSSKTHGAWLNLANGNADILFLVAPTEDELNYFAEKNVDIEMKVYGYDGLVFIGNESNPIENLTSHQIRDIYSGNRGAYQYRR